MSETTEEVVKVNGTWKGTPISIKKVWGGHEFTAEECTKLFNDELIEFDAVSKKTGNSYTAKGKIEEQEYDGNTFIGFKPIFEENKNNDEERFEGTWNNKSVKIKKIWSDHEFTKEEQECLLSGGTIKFTATSKKTGNTYTVTGKLAEQSYEGRTFIGFKPEFN